MVAFSSLWLRKGHRYTRSDSRDVTPGSLTTYQGRHKNNPTIQGADKSLARPGRKQSTATEDFNFRISYL
jgi:hypothetical protein